MKGISLILMCLIFLASFNGLVSSGNSEAVDDNHILVKVYLEDKEQWKQIASMDIDIIEFKQRYLKVFITKEQLVAIEKMGLNTERLDLSEIIDESVFGIENAGLYHTYDEITAELFQIESDYSDIAKVYDIGDSIEGRGIWAIKISDNPAIEEADEPEVLYMGAHHAREWISVEVPMYLAYYLTGKYGIDPNITDIVNEREIWIVPMVNPDGVEYSQTVYQMWRKNKRDNDGDGVFEKFGDGVDLNRNYGYEWGYDNIGSSPYPWAETYRGTSAFSEPETQAIRDLALQHDFVFSISFHSYGELVLYPWGYIDRDTPDHRLYYDIATKMNESNRYTHGNARDGIIYNTNGDSDDWLYGNTSTLAYTFELGNMFIPPESQIEDIWLENKEASLYLLQIADNPYQIYPSIEIYTDKENYSTNDTMEVGLNLTNPGDAIDVGIYIWVDLPDGNKYWMVQKPLAPLPAGFNYENEKWKSITLLEIPSGDYAWHGLITDPISRYVLTESTTVWIFNSGATVSKTFDNYIQGLDGEGNIPAFQ